MQSSCFIWFGSNCCLSLVASVPLLIAPPAKSALLFLNMHLVTSSVLFCTSSWYSMKIPPPQRAWLSAKLQRLISMKLFSAAPFTKIDTPPPLPKGKWWSPYGFSTAAVMLCLGAWLFLNVQLVIMKVLLLSNSAKKDEFWSNGNSPPLYVNSM